jgi:predicted RNase H-like nuclease (RuvC/YqgF family)
MSDGAGDVGRGIKARPAAENADEENSDPSRGEQGHAPGTMQEDRGQDTRDNETMQDNPSVEQLEQRIEQVEAHNEALSRRQDHLSGELARLETLVERVKGVVSRAE